MKLTKAQTTEIVWFKINGKLNTRILNIKQEIYKDSLLQFQLITTKTIKCSKNWKQKSVRTDTAKCNSRTFQSLLCGF